MKHAQTIAMARSLLAQGRAGDVGRMVEPLVRAGADGDVAADVADASAATLHVLAARTRLVYRQDVAGARALLAPLAEAPLPPLVTAEAALWSAWADALEPTSFARLTSALRRLRTAAVRFEEAAQPTERCWALLGQALVLTDLDEPTLADEALEEAGRLNDALDDALVALWTQEIALCSRQAAGRLDDAAAHLRAFRRRAASTSEAALRAEAYAAGLAFDLGRPASAVRAQAAAALAALRGVETWWRPLAQAHGARLGAAVRAGDDEAARAYRDEALDALGTIPTARAALLLTDVDRLLRGGHPAAARAAAAQAAASLHPANRILHARLDRVEWSLFLSVSDVARAEGALDAAAARLVPAALPGPADDVRLARARTHLHAGRPDDARVVLDTAPAPGGLPHAAARLHLQGLVAEAASDARLARSCLTQALAAYSRMEDRAAAAGVQADLKRCGLELALAGGQHPDGLCACRDDVDPATPVLGATLARAAGAPDLVVATWLRAVHDALPASWTAVYRRRDTAWDLVQEHGDRPADLLVPDLDTDPRPTGDVAWIQLPGPSADHVFALASTDGAPDGATGGTTGGTLPDRLSDWLPVLALALHASSHRHEQPLPDPPDAALVGAAGGVQDVARRLPRLRASRGSVLIHGEPGTGKRHVARLLQPGSAAGPLLVLDAAALGDEGVERALFGASAEGTLHEGALRRAAGGTVLIDDVAALPPAVQRRLARFLRGETGPDGARPLPVRVVATLSEAPAEAERAGRLDAALRDALSTAVVALPPLRERRGDVVLLAHHFLRRLTPSGAPVATLTQEARDALLRYPWPGNVRQLRNELERALVFVGSEPAPVIDVADLSPALREEPPASADVAWPLDRIHGAACSLDDVLADTERAVIEQVLARHHGQVSAAAETLGLTRQGLYKKMKRLHVDPARFHADDPSSTS